MTNIIPKTNSSAIDGTASNRPPDNALAPPGKTFTLTTGVDIVNASNPNATDIVKGVVDGDAGLSTGGSTYTHGDTVNGNGNTIVELTVVDGSDAAIAYLNNIADVNIVAADNSSVTFNAVQWSGIGAVNLVRGADGMSVFVDLLEDGVDLSIASGISGSLSADYVSGLEVDLFAGKASALSWIEGDIDATVAARESATITAFMPAGDVSVGNINSSVATRGRFGAFVSASQSGDISVGDVTITADTSATVSVSLSNIDGGSVTVGDVSMLGGAFFEFFGVYNQDAIGDVLVGDVSMSVSASGSLFLTASNTGTTGESLGSLTMGAIDLVLDHDSFGSVNILNSNTFSSDGLSLGALTVGDMSIALGRGGSMDVWISHSAIGPTANVLASFGDVELGNLEATIGTNSFLSYDVFVNNSLSGDIASVMIGDVNLDLADGASVSYFDTVTAEKGEITSFVMGDVVVDMGVSASINSFDVFLTASNGGNIGTVVIGDLSATVGQNSDFDDYRLGIFATSGTIDSVTVGDVSAVVADSGSFFYSASITGGLGAGDVTFGDFDLTANDVDSLSVELFVSASTGDVGSVTVGDVSIAATGLTPVFFGVFVSASGDAGELNIGNISFDTTVDALISMSLSSTGGLVDGDINIAGLSFNGTGSTLYNGAFLSITTTGDVSLGDLNVGLSIADVANTLPDLDLTNLLGGLVDSITGTVDYSNLALSWTAGNADAGNGVVINLTGYKGNTKVIGSDYNDNILDNTGINHLTGGGGADLFVFDTANTGKTLTTMDQVLDFTNTDGDKLDVGVNPNPGTYAEQSFTDFAAFNSAANAADKEVFVGAVTGSDLIVASDFNSDGNVDFMIQLVGLNLNQVDLASFV